MTGFDLLSRITDFDSLIAKVPDLPLGEIVDRFAEWRFFSDQRNNPKLEEYRKSLLTRAQSLINQIGSGRPLSGSEKLVTTAFDQTTPLPDSVYYLKQLALSKGSSVPYFGSEKRPYNYTPNAAVMNSAPELSLMAWRQLAKLSLQPFWQYIITNVQADLDNLDDKYSFYRVGSWLNLYKNVLRNQNALQNVEIVEREPENLSIVLETLRDRHSQVLIDDQKRRFEKAVQTRPISLKSIHDAGNAIKQTHMVFSKLQVPTLDDEQLPASVEAKKMREERESETIGAMNNALDNHVYAYLQTGAPKANSKSLEAIVKYTTKGSQARQAIEEKIAELKRAEQAEMDRKKSEEDAQKDAKTILGLSVGVFTLIVIAVLFFLAGLIALLVVALRNRSRKTTTPTMTESTQQQQQASPPPQPQPPQAEQETYSLM